MRLSIVWTARAEKDRGQLDAPTRERIIGAIERFAETGVGDVKALADRSSAEPFGSESATGACSSASTAGF